VYHVDQLRAGFKRSAGRKCDTCKALEFSTFWFGTRSSSSNKVVEYHLWTVLDALGIPRCGLHVFRHSHTALLLDSGATPKVVQRQLRRADARTTLEIYGHVVGDAHRVAVEKVASILDATGRRSTSIN
jgi:integrase